MDTPNIDYELFVEDYLPPSKRGPKWLGWTKTLLSQVKREFEILWAFFHGSTVTEYFDIGTSYGLDDEIIYKYQVFKSLADNNQGNVPDSTIQNPIYWQLILKSTIGALESSCYVAQKITLEWALNRYFRKEISDNFFPGFVQPDDPINPTNSTIYIENFVLTEPTLLVGWTEAESGVIGYSQSYGYITFDEQLTNASPFLFVVFIPTTVYSDIDIDPDIAETVVRQFLDDYIVLGTEYIIQTY